MQLASGLQVEGGGGPASPPPWAEQAETCLRLAGKYLVYAGGLQGRMEQVNQSGATGEAALVGVCAPFTCPEHGDAALGRRFLPAAQGKLPKVHAVLHNMDELQAVLRRLPELQWPEVVTTSSAPKAALPHHVGLGRSPCFDGRYSADRCCADPDEDPDCWDRTGYSGFQFEACCDPEARALALAAKQRWDALFSGPSLGGCAAAKPLGGRVRFLSSFGAADESLDGSASTAAAGRRHAGWRRPGSEMAAGRCAVKDDISESATQVYESIVGADAGMLGSGTRWVVNLGAGSWEDPMYALARRWNLSGVFVDPKGPPDGAELEPHIRFLAKPADPDNLRSLLLEAGLPCNEEGGPPVPIEALKVDIDGCDCALVSAALRLVHPKLVIMEINANIPPPLQFARQCHADWPRAFSRLLNRGRIAETYGCSLAAAAAAVRAHGYGLHGLRAVDALFVEGGVGIDEVDCYDEAVREGELAQFVHVQKEWVEEWMALSPPEALAQVWCNLTLYDWLLGLSHIPFSLLV